MASLFLGVKQALAQFDGADPMTFKAERPHIGKVAFAAAFGNRYDVIGVPEGFPISHVPSYACSGSRGTPQFF